MADTGNRMHRSRIVLCLIIVDLICAIATPSAQSAYNAAMDKDIPVVYTAVTDPVAAELADKDG